MTEEKKHICVICRRKYPESQMVYGPDPYDEDINGITDKVWECDPCYENSLMDI